MAGRKGRRTRRSPEQARALILEAATRVLSEKGPDGASLTAIAEEAGVSHSLVVHYFGSFEAVVEAAMARQLQKIRADLLAQLVMAPHRGPEVLIEGLFDALRAPEIGRMIGWALMTGRLERDDFFARRRKNPRRLAHMIEVYLRSTRGAKAPSREDIEFTMLFVISAAFGYAMGGDVLWDALDVKDRASRDADFRVRVSDFARRQLLGGGGEPDT